MNLAGKTALVTGDGRGIGRAIALRLARAGADVTVNYTGDGDDEAAAVVREVEASGRRGFAVRTDVSRPEATSAMIDEVVREFGRLDILVNNAGVEMRAGFLDVTEADYDRVLGVNLKGVYFTSQAFARHLEAVGRPGRVIIVSSVHEEIPFPGYSTYCASKGGVRSLTRDLVVELGPRGITVNSVAPGAIATEMNRALEEDPAKKDALLRQIPLGRLGRPDDMAGVVAFLASDDASYVTASTYFVDGGLTWFYEE